MEEKRGVCIICEDLYRRIQLNFRDPDHEDAPGIAGVALGLPRRRLQPVAWGHRPLLHRRQRLHSTRAQVWLLPLQVQFNRTQLNSGF